MGCTLKCILEYMLRLSIFPTMFLLIKLHKYLTKFNKHFSTGDDGLNSRENCKKHEAEHVTDETRLSQREIERASRIILDQWHSLGNLLDIQHHEMNDILQCRDLSNVTKKAAGVLQVYNKRDDFSREELGVYLDEVKVTGLKDKIIKGELRLLR